MTGNNQISDDEKRYTGDNSKMKTLIVYYSMEGNTEYAAEKIASELGVETLRIEPLKAYPTK
jgi:hypothetical protein